MQNIDGQFMSVWELVLQRLFLGGPFGSKRVAAALIVSLTMVFFYLAGMSASEVMEVGDRLVPVALILIGGESIKDTVYEMRNGNGRKAGTPAPPAGQKVDSAVGAAVAGASVSAAEKAPPRPTA